MKGKKNRKSKRANFFIIFFVICMMLLLGRMFFLMFIKDDYYQKQAYSQQILKKNIYSTRGEIVDSSGITLAATIEVANVFLDPEIIREVYGEKLHEDIDELFYFLQNNFDLKRNDLLKILAKNGHYYVILRKISKSDEEKILKYKLENNISGIYTERDVMRVYPSGETASQIVGFVNGKEAGQLGIEYKYEDILRGTDGTIVTQIDGVGREIPFSTSTTIDAENGSKIYLTINSTIQNYAQNALEKAIEEYKVLNGGTVIIMDPNNAKVIALASYPYFNPNSPDEWVSYIDKIYSVDENATKIEKISKYVWRNKAISDSYEPGSTFKAITLAACLEEGIVTPDEKYNSESVVVDGWTINHWMEDPPKEETIRQAMYNSSNPVFVRIAQELGMNKFYEYIDDFGFNAITGIELPAEAGAIFADRPNDLDMAVNSFGQRFQITPLQMITSYCALANGGDLLKPHIIDKIESSGGKIEYEAKRIKVREVISDETSKEITNILEGTVKEGTGINAYIKGYRVAGKTGTSETLDTKRYIASFAGFAPANAPQLAILVILDYPSIDEHGGGYVAAPIAREILESSLSYLKVEREYNEKDMEIINKEKEIPDLYRMEQEKAIKILEKENIKYMNLCEDDDIIIKQLPQSQTRVSCNPIVVIYDNYQNYKYSKVPNLIGKSRSEAADELARNYLNVNITGFGEVVWQSKESGEEVLSGSVIDIELRETEFSRGD